MQMLRLYVLFCLVSLLACEQERKQTRNLPAETNDHRTHDSIELMKARKEYEQAQEEHNLERGKIIRAQEKIRKRRDDSLFLARLRRLDTVFVGKGLILHCKATNEPFRYKNGDLEKYAKQLYIEEDAYHDQIGKSFEKYHAIREKREDIRIAKFPDRVRRTATHLEMRLANGRWQLHRQPHGDMSNPTFLDYIKEKGLYLVHIALYEGERFVLIDRQGQETILTGMPVFSPTRRYFVGTQYAGADPNTLLKCHFIVHPFHLQISDKPQKRLLFGQYSEDSYLMPENLLDAGELFGRVLWIKENVFLMEVCSWYSYDDEEKKKANFGVIRCEIEETNE